MAPRKTAAASKAKTGPATKSKTSTTDKTRANTKAKVTKKTGRAGRPAKKSVEDVTKIKRAATAKAKNTKAATTTAASNTKTTSRKRKADDELEAPVKKARVQKKPAAKAPATKPATRKAAIKAKKPAPVKAPKPKVIINEAPTEKLNVYVCGEGSSGELGLGTAKNAVDVKRPRLNPLLDANTVGVVQIAVGGMHCLALTHDNQILSWGVNDQGALGRDTTWEGKLKDMDAESDSDSDDDDSGMNPREAMPARIPATAFPEGTVFTQVAAADSSSFALTDEGLVYGWGTFRVCLYPIFLFLFFYSIFFFFFFSSNCY